MRIKLPLLPASLLLLFLSVFNFLEAQEITIEANQLAASEYQSTLSQKFRTWNVYMLKKSFAAPSIQTRAVRVELGSGSLVFSGSHHALTDSKTRLTELGSSGRRDLPFPELLFLNSKSSRLTVGNDFILGETVVNGEPVMLEQLRNIDPSAPGNILISYKKSDVIPDKEMICETMPNHRMTRKADAITPSLKDAGAAATCRTIEFAVLANSTSFALHSNNMFTTASYIASIYNLSEEDYTGQFTSDFQFKITEIVVSTSSAANPWLVTDDIYTNLNNFNITAGSYFKSPNDLSSFWFNTKNFTGGVVGLAFMGATCYSSGDAAIREYGSSAQSMRCLLSHEHGHNFNMDHDASGAPFIMAPSVNPNNTDFSTGSISNIESWIQAGATACMTQCNTEPCEETAPVSLTIVSNASTGTIEARWDNETGLNGYIVRWKEQNAPAFTADTIDADASSYTIALNCNAGKNYRVEVAKICAGGFAGQFRGAELVNLSIPTITANKAIAFCTGGEVTLTSGITSGNQWYKNNKIIAGATNRTLVVASSGVYTVKVNSAPGCLRVSDPITVTVTAFPVKPSVTYAGDTIVCAGTKLTLTSSAASGNQWLKNNVAISGANARTYLPTATGKYAVKVTNAGGCAAISDPVNIIVSPLPPVPVVSAGGTLKLCPGTSVKLSSSVASGNQWYKDNVAIAGAIASSYKVTAAGIYLVKVKNSSSRCFTTSAASKVTYSDLPPKPVVTATTPLNFCAGGSVLLSSSSTTGNQWFKDGVLISGAVSRTYKANIAGKYSVRVTNAGGCSVSSLTVTVVVYALPAIPAVTPAGPLKICAGTEVLLTSVTATGYQWYKNNILISGATAKTYKANATGKYTVAVKNVYGCSSVSVPVVVTVLANPAKPVVKAGGSLTICAGNQVVLTSNTITGNQWYKDGKALVDSVGKSIRVSLKGKYYLKVTNSAGCTSTSDTFNLVVNALPAIPRVVSNGALVFCSGKEITLTSYAANGNQWYKNDLAIPGSTLNTLKVNSSGNYKTILTNENGCSVSSLVTVVTVNPLPANPVVTSAGPLTICTGNKVLLSSNADAGNQWLKNGVAISGATGKTYEASIAALYSVKVTTASGCFLVSPAVEVLVNASPAKPALTRNGTTFKAPTGYAAYTWYKNGTVISAAISDTYVATEAGTYRVGVTAANGCVGLSDEFVLAGPVVNHGLSIQPALRCYPNPARDYVQLQFGSAMETKCTIRIYDRFGKLVLMETMKGSAHTLRTSGLASGVYQIVVNNNSYQATTKIVIAR